jgi:glycosyl transferase family 2
VKFAVGILTHNAIRHFRLDLLELTIASARLAFPCVPIVVLDNGSTDGTEAVVAGLTDVKGVCYQPDDGNRSPGRGMNRIYHELRHLDADVLVFSDDDMLWGTKAMESFTTIFSSDESLSTQLLLVSGYLEPCWSWNTPRGTVDCHHGDKTERILIRDSAPACAWAIPKWSQSLVFPLVESFGQDVQACQRLQSLGKVAQLDLAEHCGSEYSTWGNNALVTSRPLDRARWGM